MMSIERANAIVRACFVLEHMAQSDYRLIDGYAEQVEAIRLLQRYLDGECTLAGTPGFAYALFRLGLAHDDLNDGVLQGLADKVLAELTVLEKRWELVIRDDATVVPGIPAQGGA